MAEVTPRPDGRPISQIFHDKMHTLISEFENTGLSNAECLGVLRIVEAEITHNLIKKESCRDEMF